MKESQLEQQEVKLMEKQLEQEEMAIVEKEKENFDAVLKLLSLSYLWLPKLYNKIENQNEIEQLFQGKSLEIITVEDVTGEQSEQTLSAPVKPEYSEYEEGKGVSLFYNTPEAARFAYEKLPESCKKFIFWNKDDKIIFISDVPLYCEYGAYTTGRTGSDNFTITYVVGIRFPTKENRDDCFLKLHIVDDKGVEKRSDMENVAYLDRSFFQKYTKYKIEEKGLTNVEEKSCIAKWKATKTAAEPLDLSSLKREVIDIETAAGFNRKRPAPGFFETVEEKTPPNYVEYDENMGIRLYYETTPEAAAVYNKLPKTCQGGFIRLYNNVICIRNRKDNEGNIHSFGVAPTMLPIPTILDQKGQKMTVTITITFPAEKDRNDCTAELCMKRKPQYVKDGVKGSIYDGTNEMHIISNMFFDNKPQCISIFDNKTQCISTTSFGM
jgi:hypothetical protein